MPISNIVFHTILKICIRALKLPKFKMEKKTYCFLGYLLLLYHIALLDSLCRLMFRNIKQYLNLMLKYLCCLLYNCLFCASIKYCQGMLCCCCLHQVLLYCCCVHQVLLLCASGAATVCIRCCCAVCCYGITFLIQFHVC